MNNSIRTNDGRLVDPFNPKPEDIRPRVFIHALSQLNRFTGHADWPYSVAQHTTILYKHVPTELRRAAIVHDFSEAWFNDLASPVKARNVVYKRHEKRAAAYIANQLGVTDEELALLDPYDKSLYIDVRNTLFRNRKPELTGMGDERTGLGVNPHEFREQTWRNVRDMLGCLFVRHFGQEVYNR